MKYLNKLKKNFVINTLFVDKENFNEPVYILDAKKEYVEAYSYTKNNKIIIKKIDITENLNTKTFITVKEFFKKCVLDDTEYKIEKVDNGDIYIRVAYFGNLALFFKTNIKENKLILTNINKYKFYKTRQNAQEALCKAQYLNEYEQIRTINYLKSKKNLKRDYLFSLSKSLEGLENAYNKQLKK